MIIHRRLFSKESDRYDTKDIIGGALAGGGALALANTKTGRLTGKVTRYHDAPVEVIDKIKEEGILSKYADDPKNLTNRVLRDVDQNKKTGLVYTGKKKKVSFGTGVQRAYLDGKIDASGKQKELLRGKSPHHKVLKLEFDYDDIKNLEKIENPELLGQKNVKDWYNLKKKGLLEPDKWDNLNPFAKKQYKQIFKNLGDDTHIFKGDISPEHIVGGKGYKKRGLDKVMKYIKNNPGRFGKEAAKVATGAALVGVGGKLLYDNRKKK